MTHVRTQIREKAKELLIGLPTAGARVFTTRVFPFGEVELPAWAIFSGAEESENLNMQGDLQRQGILILRGYASLASDIDDTLDQMAVEAEKAMTPTLDGLAKLSVLTSTEFDVSGEGETEVGSIQMEYTVLYITSGNDPEVAK